jgi:formate C-acetyltransferase
MNAARCMERVFTVRRADALACATWDNFAALFAEELRHDLEEADALSKEFNVIRSRDCNVLSALFMAGCIERAKSPTRGGASRLVPVIDLLGTPNVIDSLCIVRQFVFDEMRCTMAELADALAADWKGHENLLADIRRYGKRYGANDPFTNGMARFYHTAVARFAEGRRDWFGMPLTFGNHTGYNDNAAKFGAITGATPDGRHKGDFLSFGGGPSAEHGPDTSTSVLLAAAQMDPEGAMCGTSILNISVPPSVVTDDGDFEKLVVMVETYFRMGGLHLQLNHVSRETLIDAQKHPEKYPNLRVRVSGFSGYFVRFKKTIQDEIIARTVTSVR